MSELNRIEPEWLTLDTVRLIHRRSLAEHGGADGVRDAGMLESALSRPVNQWHYEDADLIKLAAAYAFGISRNHPFVDGNKRTSYAACRLFLRVNGLDIRATQADKYAACISLASSEWGEAEFEAWLRGHVVAR